MAGEKANGAKRVYLRAGMEGQSCSEKCTGHSRHSARRTHAGKPFIQHAACFEIVLFAF